MRATQHWKGARFIRPVRRLQRSTAGGSCAPITLPAVVGLPVPGDSNTHWQRVPKHGTSDRQHDNIHQIDHDMPHTPAVIAVSNEAVAR